MLRNLFSLSKRVLKPTHIELEVNQLKRVVATKPIRVNNNMDIEKLPELTKERRLGGLFYTHQQARSFSTKKPEDENEIWEQEFDQILQEWDSFDFNAEGEITVAFSDEELFEEQQQEEGRADAQRFLSKQTPTKLRSARRSAQMIRENPGPETSFMAEFGEDPFSTRASIASQIDVPQEFLNMNFMGGWRTSSKQSVPSLPKREFREVYFPDGPIVGRQFQTMMEALEIHKRDFLTSLTAKEMLQWIDENAKEFESNELVSKATVLTNIPRMKGYYQDTEIISMVTEYANNLLVKVEKQFEKLSYHDKFRLTLETCKFGLTCPAIDKYFEEEILYPMPSNGSQITEEILSCIPSDLALSQFASHQLKDIFTHYLVRNGSAEERFTYLQKTLNSLEQMIETDAEFRIRRGGFYHYVDIFFNLNPVHANVFRYMQYAPEIQDSSRQIQNKAIEISYKYFNEHLTPLLKKRLDQQKTTQLPFLHVTSTLTHLLKDYLQVSSKNLNAEPQMRKYLTPAPLTSFLVDQVLLDDVNKGQKNFSALQNTASILLRRVATDKVQFLGQLDRLRGNLKEELTYIEDRIENGELLLEDEAAGIEERLMKIDRQIFSESKNLLHLIRALLSSVKAYIHNFNVLGALKKHQEAMIEGALEHEEPIPTVKEVLTDFMDQNSPYGSQQGFEAPKRLTSSDTMQAIKKNKMYFLKKELILLNHLFDNQNFLRFYADFDFKISTPDLNLVKDELAEIDVTSTFSNYLKAQGELLDICKEDGYRMVPDFIMHYRRSTLIQSDDVFRDLSDFLLNSLGKKLELLTAQFDLKEGEELPEELQGIEGVESLNFNNLSQLNKTFIGTRRSSVLGLHQFRLTQDAFKEIVEIKMKMLTAKKQELGSKADNQMSNLLEVYQVNGLLSLILEITGMFETQQDDMFEAPKKSYLMQNECKNFFEWYLYRLAMNTNSSKQATSLKQQISKKKEQSFDRLSLHQLIDLNRLVKEYGLKKSGPQKLANYIFEQLTDKLVAIDSCDPDSPLVPLVEAQPELAVAYMDNYHKLWRGSRSRSVTSSDLDQMLDFCAQHFEILTENNYKGVHLRSHLQKTLICLENDIKVEAYDQKERLKELINRDKSLAEEAFLEKLIESDRKGMKYDQTLDSLKEQLAE